MSAAAELKSEDGADGAGGGEEGAGLDECDESALLACEARAPNVRAKVGEGGLAALFDAGAEPAPAAAPPAVPSGATGAPPPPLPLPTGSVTVGKAERRTCHSGSSQRHSVVFLRRECGSDLVGEGM